MMTKNQYWPLFFILFFLKTFTIAQTSAKYFKPIHTSTYLLMMLEYQYLYPISTGHRFLLTNFMRMKLSHFLTCRVRMLGYNCCIMCHQIESS